MVGPQDQRVKKAEILLAMLNEKKEKVARKWKKIKEQQEKEC